MVLVKTIIFTIIVPGVIIVFIPYEILTSSSAPTPMQFGILQYYIASPILLGATVYFWCAWDFTFTGRGTPALIAGPKELVVRGLYRYVRNPMYIGFLSILLGEALLFESLKLLGYTAVMFSFFYFLVVFLEEPILKDKFGESYEKYCQSVARWLPLKIKR
jgi:protein-S-isoprenylcysteine O-methyltransferase Ste14